jgi:hypothetical protein
MRGTAFWLSAAGMIAVTIINRRATPSQPSGDRDINPILRLRSNATRQLLQKHDGNIKLVLRFGKHVNVPGHYARL